MFTTKLTPDDIRFILNVLRQGTIKWQGRAECLQRARKKVFVRNSKAGTPIYKYHWQCAECLQWTKDEKEMQVDHIVEIGAFSGDWNDLIHKMYARPVSEHLQALCLVCHLKKTMKFNSARTRYKRKKENVS